MTAISRHMWGHSEDLALHFNGLHVEIPGLVRIMLKTSVLEALESSAGNLDDEPPIKIPSFYNS